MYYNIVLVVVRLVPTMSVNGCDIVKTIRIIGGCCGVLVCVLGVLNVINTVNWPSSFIYGVYQFLFGLLIIVGELHIRWIMKWFAFLGSFIGQYPSLPRSPLLRNSYASVFLGFGAFYIFVGLLSGVSEWYYVLICKL